MASLLEHVMLNKLSEEINDAINDVGGDTSNISGPMDYPDIIRDQLSAKGATEVGVLKAGEGVTIKKISGGYEISSNAGGTILKDLHTPHNIDSDPNEDIIPAGSTIQYTLGRLFDDVLPTLPSVLEGDVIVASSQGSDPYTNPNYPTPSVKTGLVPNNTYIRIFIASQQEPVYINCETLKGTGGSIATVEYEGEDSDTIDIEVDNINHTISAELKSLGNVIINENNISQELLDKLQPDTMDEGAADSMFDDIFGN